MKLGIFGGTFNPIHHGHLIIAEVFCDRLALDRVLFIPSARPPHKTDQPVVDFSHRYRMIQLAIDGHASFECSDIENRMEGPSYTVQTLELLRAQYRDDEFFLIVGADSLLDLNNWKDPERIVKLARLAVYPRIGCDYSRADPRFTMNADLLDKPVIEIASTWIRERIAEHRSFRCLVPDRVHAYILQHHLFVA